MKTYHVRDISLHDATLWMELSFSSHFHGNSGSDNVPVRVLEIQLIMEGGGCLLPSRERTKGSSDRAFNPRNS